MDNHGFISAAQKRAEAVRLIESRIGKNSYTQGANRDYVFGKPDGASKGYGDCSSTVYHVLKRAAGLAIGGNTSAQVANRAKGLLVEDNRDGRLTSPTASKLKPGDCIYYKGTPGNTWGVGHVEMATSQTQCVGHGSGTGPTRKNIKTYSQGRSSAARRYLCVIRWIRDDDAPVDADWVVSGDSVNVRALPTTESAAVGIVHKGDKLGALDTNGWLPMLHAGAVAWVSPLYAKASGGVVEITGGMVNLRDAPSTSGRVVTVAKLGDTRPLADIAGWLPVLQGGAIRWISRKYVRSGGVAS